MRLSTHLLTPLVAATLGVVDVASAQQQDTNTQTLIKSACDDISAQISKSSAFITKGASYLEAIAHWIKSSEQKPACVVQPGSAEDLAVAIRAVGKHRAPFAVQSGGHTSNPGFSSTTGVHISLSKLNEVTLSSDRSTVRVGMGNRWSDVYKKLDGSGKNVVGGRVAGPGVGGFSIGGGYSWKTNEYGLTIDTIKSYTLVLPNGTITKVDDSTPDLFFALRGGFNRFGVLVDAEFATHDQVPKVYAGTRLYSGENVDRIVNATSEFIATNKDPKANVITTMLGSTAAAVFFYDGPEKPESFKGFDGIDTLLINSVKTQSFSDFVNDVPSEARKLVNNRAIWETFSTTGTTLKFLQALKTEAVRLSKLPRGNTAVNVVVDAYIPGAFGKHAVANTAFPHSESQFPVLVDAAWTSEADDDYWRQQLRQSRNALKAIAAAEGILHPISYSNYAAADTPAQELFGAENAARLVSIRDAVDPARVMDLTGGFVLGK